MRLPSEMGRGRALGVAMAHPLTMLHDLPPLTSHQSLLTNHFSPITSHQSLLTNHFSLLIQTQRNQKIDRVLQALVLQLGLGGLAGFLFFVGIEFRIGAVDQSRFI